MFTEGILERINNPNLQNPNNAGRIVLDGTIFSYLDHYDNHVMDMFLTRADGSYLDAHGKDFGIFRRENESDASYRNRILLEQSMLESTVDFSKLDVDLFVYFDEVLNKNQLTSRNEYLKKEHDSNYVFIASGSDREYLETKFLLNDDIRWVD